MNVYLFRHATTNDVLVSHGYRLTHSHLKQIRDHRPQLKVRYDLWVPFAVVTGLPQNHAAALPPQIAKSFRFPRGKLTMPLRKTVPLLKWTVPEQVKEKTTNLCRVLTKYYKNVIPDPSEIIPEKEVTSNVFGENDIAENSLLPLPSLTPGTASNISLPKNVSIYWERQEFERIPLESGMRWPEYISHRPLKLIRNRFPVVPGFCLKKMNDENAPPEPPMKRKKGYAITRADKQSKKIDPLNLLRPKRILVPVTVRTKSGESWTRLSRKEGLKEGASMPNGSRRPKLNDTLKTGRRRPRTYVKPNKNQ